jgi:hypothetical protein
MSNAIIGVRYIGKKDRQEDTVCKTGAVWIQGQVHNFAGNLAKKLLVHTDSFEAAEISMDGGTYLSGSTGNAKPREVAAFVNLAAMGVDHLVLFARRELNRVVNTDGKDEAQIRTEVHALMSNHSLDQEAERRLAEMDAGDGRRPFPYMATPEEYAALQSGDARLMLVPCEIVSLHKEGVEVIPPADQPEAEAPSGGEAETLVDLLARLEKPELLAFAKQEGVPISNTMTAEKLREKIHTDLSARSLPAAA